MQRRIELEGCHNFRDLGGYPAADGRQVRWRTLFRSDALHLLTATDVERFRGELGVADVVDLRSSGERRNEAPGLLSDTPLRFHHVPLFDGEITTPPPEAAAADLTLGDRYFLMLEFAKEPIARVISVLADSKGAAVYHCAAGKDRTGVISAILLGLLDVCDEVIVADYAATQENLDSIIDRLMDTEGYQEIFDALPPDTLHAEPETMLSLLAKVREHYGSMRDYARAIGVSDETLSHLQGRLLK